MPASSRGGHSSTSTPAPRLQHLGSRCDPLRHTDSLRRDPTAGSLAPWSRPTPLARAAGGSPAASRRRIRTAGACRSRSVPVQLRRLAFGALHHPPAIGPFRDPRMVQATVHGRPPTANPLDWPHATPHLWVFQPPLVTIGHPGLTGPLGPRHGELLAAGDVVAAYQAFSVSEWKSMMVSRSPRRPMTARVSAVGSVIVRCAVERDLGADVQEQDDASAELQIGTCIPGQPPLRLSRGGLQLVGGRQHRDVVDAERCGESGLGLHARVGGRPSPRRASAVWWVLGP